MLWLLVLTAAWAAPAESLRGSATGQLFRDSLDRLDQPAQISADTALDVWTQLGWRGGGLDVNGAVIAPWGRHRFGAFLGWDRASFHTDGQSPNAEGTNALHIELAWARKGLAAGWGASLWVDHSRFSEPALWDGDGVVAANILADTTQPARQFTEHLQGGLRVGRVKQTTWGGTRSLHLGLNTVIDAVTAHGVDAAGEALDGYAFDPSAAEPFSRNRSLVRLEVVSDALRPAKHNGAWRTWLVFNAGAGAAPYPKFALSGPISIDGLLFSQSVYTNLAADLRVLRHLALGPADLRVGGRAAVGGRFDLADLSGWRAGETRDRDYQLDVRVAVSVPLALELPVHPRVTLRAYAEPSWQAHHVQTGVMLQGAEHETTWSDQALISGSLGVRWNPDPVLTVDLATFAMPYTPSSGVVGVDPWLSSGSQTTLGALASITLHPPARAASPARRP